MNVFLPKGPSRVNFGLVDGEKASAGWGSGLRLVLSLTVYP